MRTVTAKRGIVVQRNLLFHGFFTDGGKVVAVLECQVDGEIVIVPAKSIKFECRIDGKEYPK